MCMPCIGDPDYAKLLTKIRALEGKKVKRAEFNIYREDEEDKCSQTYDEHDHKHICDYISHRDQKLCEGVQTTRPNIFTKVELPNRPSDFFELHTISWISGLWSDWPSNQTCSSKMDCHRLFGMESCKCFVTIRCQPIYDEEYKAKLETEKVKNQEKINAQNV